MYHETVANIAAIIIFIGFNGTFLPQFVMGSRGMPRRYYNYIEEFQGYHIASTIGAYILGIGLFMSLFCLLHSVLKGPKAPLNHGMHVHWISLTQRRHPLNITSMILHRPQRRHMIITNIESCLKF
jgi:heme/copper-type cytochrome/quinol oxidase subunit 1